MTSPQGLACKLTVPTHNPRAGASSAPPAGSTPLPLVGPDSFGNYYWLCPSGARAPATPRDAVLVAIMERMGSNASHHAEADSGRTIA